MKGDRQDPRVRQEVTIGRQDRQAAPLGDRAQEEVRVRALDASRAALVEARSRPLVVLRCQCGVREGAQVLLERLVVGDRPDAREQFLPDRAHDGNPPFPDELAEFRDGVVHPTINVDELDPDCDMPGLVLNEPQEKKRVDYILNNSFGMLGINSVVIIGRI